MLSMISKIYDPLGLTSPFLLTGKGFFKSYARTTLAGMNKLAETTEQWEQWKNELKLSENINLDRCFKSSRFGRLIDCSLHHWSDASQDGYGQVSYLRLVDKDIILLQSC